LSTPLASNSARSGRGASGAGSRRPRSASVSSNRSADDSRHEQLSTASSSVGEQRVDNESEDLEGLGADEIGRILSALASSNALLRGIRQRQMAKLRVDMPEEDPVPLPIDRPLPRLEPAQTEVDLKRNARQVYQASVTYHATDEQGKRDIQEHGFLRARKTNGATARAGFPDPNSSSHYYLFGLRADAKKFADRHLLGSTSAIVGVLGAGQEFPVESDPKGVGLAACRTGSDIGRHLGLGSRRSPPGNDAEGFRLLLDKAGMKVDRKKAGELLREVQSDSEDEMPGDDPPDDLYD
jgi:type III effector protein AvrRpm1